MIALMAAYNVFLLLFSVLIYTFMERKIQARAQHRVGVRQLGAHGYRHILAESAKNISKNAFASWRDLNFLRQSSLVIAVLSPIIFYLVLTMGSNYHIIFGSGGLLLCMILLSSLIVEDFFLYFQTKNNEHLKIRKSQIPNFIGFSIFFVCLLVPAVKAGGAGLWDLDKIQESFPFLMAISSPALFVAAVISFLSIFYILNLHPIASYQEKFSDSTSAFLLLFAKRLWVIALITYWVFVFWGGRVGGLMDFPVYAVRMLAALFLLCWVGVALPGIRSSNSMEMALKALLPAGIFSLVLEILWIGFLK